MSNITPLQILVQTNLESAKSKLANVTDKFVKNPMYGMDFGWHIEMAVYDELVKYFEDLEVTTEGWETITDESVQANVRRWMDRLVQETSPTKRDVWRHIIKFWYNVADIYEVDLGELKHFRYSV